MADIKLFKVGQKVEVLKSSVVELEKKAPDTDREEHGSVLQCTALGIGVCHPGRAHGLNWDRREQGAGHF